GGVTSRGDRPGPFAQREAPIEVRREERDDPRPIPSLRHRLSRLAVQRRFVRGSGERIGHVDRERAGLEQRVGPGFRNGGRCVEAQRNESYRPPPCNTSPRSLPFVGVRSIARRRALCASPSAAALIPTATLAAVAAAPPPAAARNPAALGGPAAGTA